MALTVVKRQAIKGAGVYGNSGYGRIVHITWDASYATGGEALTAADLDFADEPTELFVQQLNNPTYLVEYLGTELLKAYWYDYNGANDGVAIEVASATDLSASPVTILVSGRKPEAGT